MKIFKQLIFCSIILPAQLYSMEYLNVIYTLGSSLAISSTIAGYKYCLKRKRLNDWLAHSLRSNAPIETIEALLKRGAMCKKPMAKIRWPQLSNEQIAQRIKLLLDYKADVNEKWPGGNSLTDSRVVWLKPEITKILLDDGSIDPETRDTDTCLRFFDKNGRTPLMDAARNWNTAMVSLLMPRLSQDSINMQDYEGRTALMWAMPENNGFDHEILKLLLSSGARLDIKDKNNHSGFIYAIKTKAILKPRLIADLLENANDQITDSDIDLAIKIIHAKIDKLDDQLLEAPESLRLDSLNAEITKRVHKVVDYGMTEVEHQIIKSKLKARELKEIEELQKLIPFKELSKNKINTLIAEYIVGPKTTSENAPASVADVEETNSTGDEIFGNFGAEPVMAGYVGMGLQ